MRTVLKDFRIHYIEDYSEGEKIRRPVNIRHVHQETHKARVGVGFDEGIRARTYDIASRNPELFSLN